jgi:hypothetical protein
VQAVSEIKKIEVNDNIPETLVIQDSERDEDVPVLELRQ